MARLMEVCVHHACSKKEFKALAENYRPVSLPKLSLTLEKFLLDYIYSVIKDKNNPRQHCFRKNTQQRQNYLYFCWKLLKAFDALDQSLLLLKFVFFGLMKKKNRSRKVDVDRTLSSRRASGLLLLLVFVEDMLVGTDCHSCYCL